MICPLKKKPALVLRDVRVARLFLEGGGGLHDYNAAAVDCVRARSSRRQIAQTGQIYRLKSA